jgi:hypothetical protein
MAELAFKIVFCAMVVLIIVFALLVMVRDGLSMAFHWLARLTGWR